MPASCGVDIDELDSIAPARLGQLFIQPIAAYRWFPDQLNRWNGGTAGKPSLLYTAGNALHHIAGHGVVSDPALQRRMIPTNPATGPPHNNNTRKQ
jgi:hypothetical protein